MEGEYQQRDFAQCLNESFEVVDEYSVPLTLELIQVSDEMASSKQRMFSIIFRGPPDRYLPQRTYKLRSQQLGEKDIFLVPVARDDAGYQYQAVFNLLM